MKSGLFLSLVIVCCFLWVSYTLPVALSCDSCGRECASACGTRHFRTCCFNYLKKRGSPPLLLPPPGLKLELWLQKSQMERAAAAAAAHNEALMSSENDKIQYLQQHSIQKEDDDQTDGGRLQLIYDA